MTDVASLCRLTVRAPGVAVDVAIPTDVAVAELTPVIVALVGPGLEEAGLAHGGWVLQRLGEEPLDGERTLQSLGVRDGQTLYLRPYRDAMPAVHHDEVVDGIADALSERNDSWRPELTRGSLLALAFGALTLVAVLLPGSGTAPALRPGLLAVGGIALMLVAARVSGLGARATLAAAGIGYLVVSVAELVPDPTAGSGMLIVALTVLVSSLVAVVGLGAGGPLFIGGSLLGLLGAIGGIALLAGQSSAGAAALVTLMTCVTAAFAPPLAARLSGLQMPMIPSNAEQLQEDIDPVPDREIADRAIRTDAYVTGLSAAIGIAETTCLVVLVASPGRWAFTMATISTVRLILQALPLAGRWVRLATLVPGCLGATMLTVRLSAGGSGLADLLVCAGLLGGAAGLVASSHFVPGRRLVPYWGRAADLLQSASAIATVPLALQVMGLFGELRTLVV